MGLHFSKYQVHFQDESQSVHLNLPLCSPFLNKSKVNLPYRLHSHQHNKFTQETYKDDYKAPLAQEKIDCKYLFLLLQYL